MAKRGYPRFLFSEAKGAIDKGPFIISTLEPHVICKVHPGLKRTDRIESENIILYYQFFALELLSPKKIDKLHDDWPKISKVMHAMQEWLAAQLSNGVYRMWHENSSPDSPFTIK